jgi:hypothetical protein
MHTPTTFKELRMGKAVYQQNEEGKNMKWK